MVKLILITGITSSLGAFLSKQLSAQGHLVYGTSRTISTSEYQTNSNTIYTVNLSSEISIKRLTCQTFPSSFDLLIHCASATPSHQLAPIDYWNINCAGLTKLLDTLRRKIKIHSILNVSTTSVYNQTAEYLDERDTAHATTPYGLSKYFAETYLSTLTPDLIHRVVSLRVPILVTPDVKNNLIANWLSKLNTNDKLEVFNPKKMFNALGDGRTISEIASLMLSDEIESGIYNLCSNDMMPVEQFARTFTEIFYKDPGCVRIAANDRVSAIISGSRIRNAGIHLRNITDTLSWFRSTIGVP